VTIPPEAARSGELLAYCRKRVASVGFVFLVALTAGLGFWVEPAAGATDAAIRIALITLLIAQFRLWDDLSEREGGRRRYPRTFLALLALLSVPVIALLFMLDNAAARIGAYGIIASVLAIVYWRRWTTSGQLLRTQWALLKYPTFVLLPLSVPGTNEALTAAAVAYVVVSVYDWKTGDA
jgi:hypothetical protein